MYVVAVGGDRPDQTDWDHTPTTPHQENIFTFCAFPFLLSAEAKRRLLHAEARLQQQQAAQQDIMRQIFQGGPVLPFSVLTVDRAQLLQSALAQIGALDGLALKKQLKVRFVGEEGVDEGEWRRTALGAVAARWRRDLHALLVTYCVARRSRSLYYTPPNKQKTSRRRA